MKLDESKAAALIAQQIAAIDQRLEALAKAVEQAQVEMQALATEKAKWQAAFTGSGAES